MKIKKRNKKGLSAIITTLLMVLLVLVAVGIVWAIVKGVIDNGLGGFKITKEVCRNETHNNQALVEEFYNIEESINDLEKIYPYCNGLLESDINISPCEEYNNVYKLLKEELALKDFELQENKIITQVCEQVEVDEIEIESNTYEINYGYWDCRKRCREVEFNHSNDDDWSKLFICLGNCSEEYTYKSPNKIILKHDLTIEWLDENCECTKECPEGYDVGFKNSVIIIEDGNYGNKYCIGRKKSISFEELNCKEYLCAEYIVEERN